MLYLFAGLHIQGSIMLFLKKIYQNLAFRCFGALSLGIAAVTFVALELAQIGLEEEIRTELAEDAILRFPENEDTLRLMSARLLQGVEAAQIEPAAGE
jgi:phage host-nuclease inhibitor protein Gam